MQSNFFRYHFGLEWEKRKLVRRVHAKRILQTVPHTLVRFDFSIIAAYDWFFAGYQLTGPLRKNPGPRAERKVAI